MAELADAHGSGPCEGNFMEVRIHPHPPIFAGMAELADAHGSGPCEGDFMQVQVLFPAPEKASIDLKPFLFP